MTAARLRELFADPPRDFSPTPLWWWSGGRVTRERLRWQLERFVAGGVYNLVVINLAPAGPIVGAQADDPAWFSEEWWERFTDTCVLAEELGVRLWFYDQIGFSGANVQGTVTHVHPTAAGHALRHREAEVRRGRVALHGLEQVVAAYEETAAPPGTSRRLPLEADGRVDAADGTRLALVTSVPTAFDYLSPPAVQLLVDLIHGEYDRRVPHFLGNVIAGSFQDELPATNSWTPAFPEEFRSRRGYDLLDHLPALWAPSTDARAAKVRGDYYAVRAELTEEALFRPLGQWHRDRGMLIGADQSNPARAGYPNQATQLYTDYFRTHRWYDATGSDHEGDAKVHSSMAHLYGHERVWMESFHSSGWGGTLEDTYDWLLPMLRSGANLFNPHASYYDTRGGWFEWAPPSTDWRQPYWQHYPDFARSVSRICATMSWGSYSASVAVLHPSATSQALIPLDAPLQHFGDGRLGEGFADVDQTQDDYLTLCGSNNWFHARPGLLDQAGISFDVIDDASVQAASVGADAVQGSALAVRDLSYSTVLLPSASVLEEGTARRLLELLDAGGQVVVLGRPPSAAAGLHGDDDVVARLAGHPGVTSVADPAAAVRAIKGSDYAWSDVPLLVRRSGADAVALVTGAYPNASAYPLRTSGHRWTDYDFDPARYAATKTVTVAAPVATAEVWDPATGRQQAAAVRRNGDHSQIEVRLDGAPAVLVTWREGEPAAPEAAPEPATPAAVATDVSDGWTGELVPTLDNTYGDLALPARAPLDRLQVWTLEWSAGDERWAPVKVTNGQSVAVHPPVPATTAPAPLSPTEVAAVRSGEQTLVDGSWRVQTHSNSRGREKESGLLGNKGLVPEEFLQIPAPAAGEVATVRTLVQTDRPGEAELVVGTGAARRAWWNGVEVTTGDGYLTVAVVEAAGTNVLELQLGPSENARGFHVESSQLGCFFALARPGGFGRRPQLMSAGVGVRPDGRVVYRHSLHLPRPASAAALVVGAATGLSILLDGRDIARQEKVEYYETPAAAEPKFFRHDVTALLPAGDHLVEIVADSTNPGDVVFVDLVAHHPAGVAAVVSGTGWATESGDTRGTSVEHRGHWSELAPAHAVPRSHPLPEVEWLHGVPEIGEPADRIRCGVDLAPTEQRFRALLPAGTTRVELPLTLGCTASVGGVAVPVADGVLTLTQPLPEPAELEVTTEPTSFHRGGAAWAGPLLLDVASAPLRLGSWRDLGLRSWSGGVCYRRTVEPVNRSGPVELDLGRVRGSVDVVVDGKPVGSAFCAPYRFPLPAGRARMEVEVTVYNTLGPFLDESTPTTWVYPSQLESGIFGPVLLCQPAETAAVRE